MDRNELEAALTALRPQLLRFARLQLRADAVAEDAVQAALLAALENLEKFAGAASVKTWVFTILKNKIIDEFRRRAREPERAPPDEDEGAELENELFIPDGHWAEFPADWGNPEAALRQSQFWTIFEACLDRLPAKPGRVFMMREFLDLDTEEICKELKISSSNCWVLLHRARLGLRECLALNWFEGGQAC